MAKWYQLYEKGGMEALIPRTRCDKGGTRVITQEAESEIRRLRREYPRLNATQVREKLVRDGVLAATVSASTVQRYIKRNGLKGIEETAVKDRKAYEEEYFGGNVKSHAGMDWPTPVTCHISGKKGDPAGYT